MTRSLFFLFLVTFFAFSAFASKVTISFADAIKLKKVKLHSTKVEGLGGGNITIQMLSLSKDSLLIYFEPGLMFEPENEAFQSLLLADSTGVLAFPREYVSASLHGYCTESSDMGPRNLARYSSFRLAAPDLQELAWLTYRAVATDQQGLVWAYQNRSADYRIYLRADRDKFRENFSDFFARNRPGMQVTYEVQPEEVKPVPRPVVSIAANFPFMTDTDRVLSLNILSESGQVVRRYFQNKRYFAGAHILQFGFSDFYEPGSRFQAQLVSADGAVFKEMWVDESTVMEEMDVHEIRYNYGFVIKQRLENLTLTAYHENGERLITLQEFPAMSVAYHQLRIVFTHYFDPKTKFILELADKNGKVYDKTEFDALGNSKKLYQEWKQGNK